MFAIYKKEIKQYFNSVIACLYIAITTLFSGIFFVVSNLNGGSPYINVVVYYSMYFMAVSIPILTMKVFSEEYKQKTDQMLITAPISIGKIVFGKFFAMWTIMIIPMILWCYYPLLMMQFGDVPKAVNYNGILAAVIYGTAILAIGMFVSSITEIQVVAAIAGIAICLVGDFMPILNNLIGDKEYGIWIVFRIVVDSLSLITPSENFINGIISISSAVYYLTIAIMFIFFTCLMLKRRTGVKKTGKIICIMKKACVPVVLAVVIAVNALALKAEEKYEWMSFDVTDNKLYLLSDETKDFLAGLKNDISIYVLGSERDADEYISELLKRYDRASDKIKVEYKDMEEYPKFYMDYTDEEPAEYSIIVVNNDTGKAKLVYQYNIYVTEMDYSSFKYIVKGYDGEGQIDSAINYVISDNNPKVYTVAGHSEYTLGEVFINEMTKMNYEAESLNLYNIESLDPKDCDLLIMPFPNTDYTKDEAKIVTDYLKNGGKALMFTGISEDFSEHPNFCSIAETYGIEINEGIVYENDNLHYIQNVNAYIIATEGKEYAAEIENTFFPISQGVRINKESKNYSESTEYLEILKTTDTAVCKKEVSDETTEYKEGDVKGPFDLLLSASNGNSKLTVAASYYAFTDEIYENRGESNLLLFRKMLKDNIKTDNVINIAQKRISYSNLVISSAFSRYMGIGFAIVLPIIILLAGIVIWARRRKK